MEFINLEVARDSAFYDVAKTIQMDVEAIEGIYKEEGIYYFQDVACSSYTDFLVRFRDYYFTLLDEYQDNKEYEYEYGIVADCIMYLTRIIKKSMK